MKANFLSMLHWLRKGVPLPFGSIRNKRSLLALDNLLDLIRTCIDHPGAANQIFLASDGTDLSTSDLLKQLGKTLDRTTLLVPFPLGLLKAGAFLVGKQDLARRLFGSLQVDITKTRKYLDWNPPVKTEQALYATTQYFLKADSQ